MKKNTNHVYDAMFQKREDRQGKNGIEGYQRELKRYMDDIQMVLERQEEGSPEFKKTLKKGKAVIQEMKRIGIEVIFD